MVGTRSLVAVVSIGSVNVVNCGGFDVGIFVFLFVLEKSKMMARLRVNIDFFFQKKMTLLAGHIQFKISFEQKWDRLKRL